MNAMLKKQHLSLLVAMTLLLFGAGSASAQPGERGRDTVRIEGSRIVIELDDDGRLVVDGRRLDGDGSYVFRVRRGDGGDTVVLHGGEGGGLFAVRPGRAIRSFRSAPFDEEFTFSLDVPNVWVEGDFDRAFGPLRDELRIRRLPFAERLKENAEVADLEHEARQLARDARRAEGAERQRLERELRTKLETIFDRKMTLRRERTEALERELQEERENLQARQSARQDMIERRMRELLGKDDALEW